MSKLRFILWLCSIGRIKNDDIWLYFIYITLHYIRQQIILYFFITGLRLRNRHCRRRRRPNRRWNTAPTMVFICLVYFDPNNLWVVLNSPATQYDRRRRRGRSRRTRHNSFDKRQHRVNNTDTNNHEERFNFIRRVAAVFHPLRPYLQCCF
jgi:hypothetical protein